MRRYPVFDHVVRKRLWLPTIMLPALWGLTVVVLSQAGWLVSHEAVYNAAWTARESLLGSTLFMPFVVATLAAARTSVITRANSPFELIRATALSDAGIVWACAGSTLYRLRWGLVLLLGLLPLMALKLAFPIRLILPHADWPPKSWVQPFSVGAMLAQIPWIVWESGLILLGAALGTVLALRWGKAAAPALLTMSAAGFTMARLRVSFEWAPLLLDASRCDFGLRCLLGWRMPTAVPIFALFVIAPYLLGLAVLRVHWARDGHAMSLPRKALEILALGVCVTVLPLGEAYLKNEAGAYKSSLLSQLIVSQEAAAGAIRSLRMLGWLEDGSLRGLRLGESCVYPCKEALLAGSDLSGADLEKTGVPHADLRGASLAGANLYRADLSFASMQQADLRGADLRAALADGVNFQGTNLRGVDLRGTELYWANLRDADLDGALLDGTTMLPDMTAWEPGVDLAIFTDASHPRFWRGAEFMVLLHNLRTEPAAVDFSHANLAGASICCSFNLQGADLHGADLRGAGLHEYDLRNANLVEADLSRADLIGVKLTGADLRGATLDSATMWSADLQGALSLTCEQLLEAGSLAGAVLPDGKTLPVDPSWAAELAAWCGDSLSRPPASQHGASAIYRTLPRVLQERSAVLPAH